MNYSYGFVVLPQEVRPRFSFDEGMDGTIFVDVDTWPRPHLPGKVVAHFYYKLNFAKQNIVTEEELMRRFPKSFKKADSGDEYESLK